MWTVSAVEGEKCQGRMLRKLEEIELALPALLADPEGWTGLDILYAFPHAQRIWRQVGEARVHLQRIFPCERDKALWCKHPWPLAVHLVQGGCEMGVGSGYGEDMDPVPGFATTQLLHQGSRYEMLASDTWRYIRPFQTSLSIMVTGKPWDHGYYGNKGPGNKVLAPEMCAELRNIFQVLYPEPSQ